MYQFYETYQASGRLTGLTAGPAFETASQAFAWEDSLWTGDGRPNLPFGTHQVTLIDEDAREHVLRGGERIPMDD